MVRKLITITAGEGDNIIYRDMNGREINSAEDMRKTVVEGCDPNLAGYSEGVVAKLTNKEWKNLRTVPEEVGAQ